MMDNLVWVLRLVVKHLKNKHVSISMFVQLACNNKSTNINPKSPNF